MQKVTIEINSPTIEQLTQIHAILNGAEKVTKTEVPEANAGLAPLAEGAKKRGKKAAPAATVTPPKTVSKDEDEDFGKEALDEEDLDDTTGGDDPANFDDEDEDEETELNFDTVKAAINKYGAKNEQGMKTIFASFNIKNTKELSGLPKKWKLVLDKVNAKLKGGK